MTLAARVHVPPSLLSRSLMSEMGEIIQLSGDQRTNVNSFLVDQEICLKSQVVIHGF